MESNIVREDIKNITSEPLDWQKLEGKNILISGANGFLASYIVHTLLYLNDFCFKKRATILAIVRDRIKYEEKFHSYGGRDDLKCIIQDISNPFDLKEPIDYIVHAASKASSLHFGGDPVGTLKANTLGTAYLLEIARKKNVEKFVYFSSGEVYGMIDDEPDCVAETYTGNVDFLDIRSCYAESKRMGENMCLCWNHQYNVPVNIIRVGYTYGPGIPLSDDRVCADFVNKVINNKNIVLNSDGMASRSFCYISDMIAAVFLILLQGKNKEVYNVASSVQTKIFELAKIIIGLYPEKKLSIEFNNIKTNKDYLRSRRKKTLVCTEKIKSLGWKRKVGIEAGFERMIESYKL